MDGYAFSRSRTLLLVAAAMVLAGPVPSLHAQGTPAIVDEAAIAPGAGGDRGQPARSAREAPDSGHDGSGYFDRGFRRIILGRSTEGHDGSGRFDHPAQPSGGRRIEEDGTANIAVR